MSVDLLEIGQRLKACKTQEEKIAYLISLTPEEKAALKNSIIQAWDKFALFMSEFLDGIKKAAETIGEAYLKSQGFRQVRTHRKSRINKKWAKRYGYTFDKEG